MKTDSRFLSEVTFCTHIFKKTFLSFALGRKERADRQIQSVREVAALRIQIAYRWYQRRKLRQLRLRKQYDLALKAPKSKIGGSLMRLFTCILP